jgi:mycofactocin system transcriptional regulator
MGRPPSTTHAQLALVALELFLEHGFDATSVDDIAAAAGVSRRTFFRYFPTKAAVLWNEFDAEIEQLRDLLAQADDAEPMVSVIHHAVVETNRTRPADVRELRARMTLINTVESLKGPTAVHYAGWVRTISDFVARRTGVPEQSLFPITVGRTVLATALAAYDVWADRGDRSLVSYLDEALGALAEGFEESALRARATRSAFTRRRPKTAD